MSNAERRAQIHKLECEVWRAEESARRWKHQHDCLEQDLAKATAQRDAYMARLVLMEGGASIEEIMGPHYERTKELSRRLNDPRWQQMHAEHGWPPIYAELGLLPEGAKIDQRMENAA